MLVLLVRHGHDNRRSSEDPPLSALGADQTRCLAEHLALRDWIEDGIEEVWTSSALRARETLDILRASLSWGWEHSDVGLGPGLPAGCYLEVIERAHRNGVSSLLIVGHNPALGEAALRLAGETENFERGLIGNAECIEMMLGTHEMVPIRPPVVIGAESVRMLLPDGGERVTKGSVAQTAG